MGLEGAPCSLQRDQRARGGGALADGIWEEPRGTGATPWGRGGGGHPRVDCSPSVSRSGLLSGLL